MPKTKEQKRKEAADRKLEREALCARFPHLNRWTVPLERLRQEAAKHPV